MALSLLQQAHTFIATNLHHLFMSSPDAGFLFNHRVKYSSEVLAYHPLPGDWVEDVVMAQVIDPAHAAFVHRIKFCKRRTLPQHEFLICYLKESDPKDGSCPRESVVLIERNEDGPANGDETDAKAQISIQDDAVDGPTNTGEVSGNDLAPTSMAQEVSSSHSGIVRSGSNTDIQALHPANHVGYLQDIPSSSSLSVKRKSGDVMAFSRNGKDTFVTKREKLYDVGPVLILPPKTFTLLQLVTLFCVAHNMEPNYTVFAYNCYWFVGLIYRTIVKLVEESREEPTSLKMGRLRGITPLSGNFETDDFVGAYNTEWERIKKKIAAAQDLAQTQIQGAEEKIKRLEAELERLRMPSGDNQCTVAPVTGRHTS